MLSSFRRAGVPLQRIRPAVEALTKEIGIEHALASERLYTDGAEVLFDYASRHQEREVMDLVVVRTQQRQFSEVVKGYLKRIQLGGDRRKAADWRRADAGGDKRAGGPRRALQRFIAAKRWD